MSRIRRDEAAERWQRAALTLTLTIAVPLHMHELQNVGTWALPAMAAEAASIIATKGDTLMFATKRTGPAADAFNALARAIAATVLMGEHINVHGTHWCPRHHFGTTEGECRHD